MLPNQDPPPPSFNFHDTSIGPSWNNGWFDVEEVGSISRFSLAPYLDEKRIYMLNTKEPDSKVQHLVLTGNNQSAAFPGIESDADAELSILVYFQQNVTIRAIKILADAKSGPETIYLYANKGLLDFSDFEDRIPEDILTFTPEELVHAREKPLKTVKFQNVNCLTLFIRSNQCQSNQVRTSLQRIVLIGSLVHNKEPPKTSPPFVNMMYDVTM